MNKKCRKCKQIKDIAQFCSDKRARGGYKRLCKECASIDNKKRREVRNSLNIEYHCSRCNEYTKSEYFNKSKKSCRPCSKKIHCPICNLFVKKLNFDLDKNQCLICLTDKKCLGCGEYKNKTEYATRSIYRGGIKSRCRKCENLSISEKKKKNINFKIAAALRSRVWHSLKNDQKGGSCIELLECSIDELKQYLESKFQPGMTWENWGLHGWHIDHIVPLSSFDLTDPDQCKIAFNYTNLQPLWAMDNWKKNDRV